MTIYSIITLIGGLAFFLYGISIMSLGLEKVAGGKLEKLLKKMTSNPFKSFALGAGITAVIQSSSAVTVMLIGLVNSGLMNLSQTVSVIIGANIGTTITAWILSLTGIQESAGFLIKLLKPETFTPILAFVGVIMMMVSKSNRRKNAGSVLIGFAILMCGMQFMASSMAPLSEMESFRNIMTAFSNPILGLLVGVVVTMVIQSSSASIGILQALAISGGVTWGAAIPIIFGQNIGTCISAILASIGVNTNARRVAAVHVIFNILGVLIFFPLFVLLSWAFKFAILKTSISAFGIALFHTAFNLLSAIILFPFIKVMERLAVKFVPDKENTNTQVLLDDRLLLAPTFAISECFGKIITMAKMVEENFIDSTRMLKSYHQKKADDIREIETNIDTYEDRISSFLLKLSGRELSEEDNSKISQLLLTLGDYERIGDHAVNILKVAEKLKENEKKLSDEAVGELKVAVKALEEIYTISSEAYKNDDLKLAQEVEPLEAVIKKLIRRIKNNHIQRLKEGQCNVELSFMFSDLLNDFRRIAAHCGNIATSIIQLHDHTLDKHEYNHRNKDEDLEFVNKYKNYKSIYSVSKKKKQEKTDLN